MKMSQTESKVYKWMCTVRERFWKIISSAFRRCGTGDKWTTEKNDHMSWWRCVKRACDGVQVWMRNEQMLFISKTTHIFAFILELHFMAVRAFDACTNTHALTRAERDRQMCRLWTERRLLMLDFFNACKSVRVEKRYTEGKSVGTVQCSNFLVNRTRMTQLCINFSVCMCIRK